MKDPNTTNLYPPGDAGSLAVDAVVAVQPRHIGRYRVDRVLGQGGFGLVYLAHDDQLQRLVAIKVPHARLVAQAAQAEAYLSEARTVANLDHPQIVPVYDVGSTDQFPCFIVSRYIDGTDLASRLKPSRLSLDETVELVVTVAEALHHAHKQGLVHRDIKPGNLLLDKSGKAFVADFGLALREQDVGKGPRYAGTPAYMSPEQARGEGHRVDGRSDIFSLGVVLYELLTGRRPFHADSQDELLELITSFEPRAPRQYDDNIPKELDRICLKALSKRASERYSTAKDMSDDLRHFLMSASVHEKSRFSSKPVSDRAHSTPVPTPATPPASDNQPIRIVPKGLRSFDVHDADFFLELLPGARDRNGLPDSIRFWKTRIEEKDADNTFAVGLIYGPSGCGKSSLVKAGLLPHLSDDVIAVYVEATAEETESRLLSRLRKRCPSLSDDLDLKETLAALRRGQGSPRGKKVVIVLDQFEQWLHAKKEEQNTELVHALRQCDGERVQCIVMVRDDFWLSVSRFLRELEIRLVDGQNSALADLFDGDHAKKVLAAFGRAFGRLPENSEETSPVQKEFLNQAVSGLAQDGKVISVRLALFSEMLKGRAWTPAALLEVGGTAGIGITFLEETFSAATAPPEHRLHQKAARGVLKALLPDSGTNIKGHMRSHGELLNASGYGSRPGDFGDLIRILDGEIRLITPTDPEGKDESSVTSLKAGEKYYQLTHDYLVPSLRDWLTRKQKETPEGRAELLLEDWADLWNAKQEYRPLPSLGQWMDILSFTQEKNWTDRQRNMMAAATEYHAMSVWNRILNANTTDVLAILEEMRPYQHFIEQQLREAFQKSGFGQDVRKQLHASLALLQVDTSQVDYLFGRLLDAEPQYVPVIRDALAPHKDALLDQLWAVMEQPGKGKESQRLRAASALATYDPESDKWAKAGRPVTAQLVAENPVFLGLWMDGFRPIKEKLLASLADNYRDTNRQQSERSLATNILTDYAADQPQVLADLVMDADENQFHVIYPKFQEQGERGSSVLTDEIDRKLPSDLPSSDESREKLARRQANAAVALLKLNQPEKVWPLLKHSPDPRLRSYLIHRLSPLGADAWAIVQQLDNEPDVTIRRALILSLGEFSERALSLQDRTSLLPMLQQMYRTDADPGIHAASEWLLRQWKQESWLKAVNAEWRSDSERRNHRLEGVQADLVTRAASAPGPSPQWYVNGQGQTLVILPGPVEFQMGSPKTEADRMDNEDQHKECINRTFAISASLVTKEQFLAFNAQFGHLQMHRYPEPTCPIGGVTWYEAAAYCNWLSREEGLSEDQWCYEITDQETKLKKDSLSLHGYRLPTEAEMEYATRAGTTTARYYGETVELLPKYAWFAFNSRNLTRPVGALKPNDFGLFDTTGNLWTWCHGVYQNYVTAKGVESSADRDEERLLVENTVRRVLRGGSFVVHLLDTRSAYRVAYVPTVSIYVIGFRLARTIPLLSQTALPITNEAGEIEK